MNDLSDAEISKRLALAIGWKEEEIKILDDKPREDIMCCKLDYFGVDSFRIFDYRDPAVIWPIAERFNKWPRKEGNEWKCDPTLTETVSTDTAAKAVALAVIKSKEQA